MEHNPTSVLAIGEIALFLIGTLLSIILLAILLLPSLMKFSVPHWVNVRRQKTTHEGGGDLLDKVLPKLMKHGYQVVSRDEGFMAITKDNATRYHIYLRSVEEGEMDETISMFRQGDETKRSGPTSILAGAGIAWVVILCHKSLVEQGLNPTWGWDDEFSFTRHRPFSAIIEQVILLNPWR